MEDTDLERLNRIGNRLQFLEEDYLIPEGAMSIIYDAAKALNDLVDRLRTENRVRLALRSEYV